MTTVVYSFPTAGADAIGLLIRSLFPYTHLYTNIPNTFLNDPRFQLKVSFFVEYSDRDGTGRGFDVELVRLVRKHTRIPIVASSGAGKAGHFVDVFEETGVEAALAAGIFHREQVGIGEVKAALVSSGLNART